MAEHRRRASYVAAWMLRLVTASPIRYSSNSPSVFVRTVCGRTARSCSVINGAEVARERHQVEVQLVVRQRAVLDDHVVDAPLDLEVGVLAPESRDSPLPVGVGSDLDEPEAESRGDVVLGECAQVRRRVHAAHQGRESALRRDELEYGAATGQELGGVHPRLGTVVVVHEDRPLRVHGTTHHVPRVDDQVIPTQEVMVRQTARCDDDDVGSFRSDGVAVREDAVAELDATELGLRETPVDDADQVTAAG